MVELRWKLLQVGAARLRGNCGWLGVCYQAALVSGGGMSGGKGHERERVEIARLTFHVSIMVALVLRLKHLLTLTPYLHFILLQLFVSLFHERSCSTE